MAIWRDLVAETGFDGGYGTVKRFVRKLRGHQPLEARAIIITALGSKSHSRRMAGTAINLVVSENSICMDVQGTADRRMVKNWNTLRRVVRLSRPPLLSRLRKSFQLVDFTP